MRTPNRKLNSSPLIENRFLLCQLERLLERQSAQPAPRRSVPISWVETEEQVLEITQTFRPTRESRGCPALVVENLNRVKLEPC